MKWQPPRDAQASHQKADSEIRRKVAKRTGKSKVWVGEEKPVLSIETEANDTSKSKNDLHPGPEDRPEPALQGSAKGGKEPLLARAGRFWGTSGVRPPFPS